MFYMTKSIFATIQTLAVQSNSIFTDFKDLYEYKIIAFILRVIFIPSYLILMTFIGIYVAGLLTLSLIMMVFFCTASIMISIISSNTAVILTDISMTLIMVTFSVHWYYTLGLSVIPVSISLYVTYMSMTISISDMINLHIAKNHNQLQEEGNFIGLIATDIIGN